MLPYQLKPGGHPSGTTLVSHLGSLVTLWRQWFQNRHEWYVPAEVYIGIYGKDNRLSEEPTSVLWSVPSSYPKYLFLLIRALNGLL